MSNLTFDQYYEDRIDELLDDVLTELPEATVREVGMYLNDADFSKFKELLDKAALRIAEDKLFEECE
jgi:hypothetical protein